jgi:hypothetical protein
MSSTVVGVTKVVQRPSQPPRKAARVSPLGFMEERLFGVSLLGIFVGASGLAIIAGIIRLLLGHWLEWLGWFYGSTAAGLLAGAIAGGLLAIPLVLLMATLQPGQGLTIRIRAALPTWALCAAAMAGVGAIGESIGGWAGWMIGGMLVGFLAGRFLETE